MTAVSSLITSLATYLLIFVVIYIIYIFLSKRASNGVIYFPARILNGAGIPNLERRGFIQWVIDVLRIKQDDLSTLAGLDAAIYIRFQTTCLAIILWSAIYCCPAIIITARTDNYYETFNAGTTNPDEQLVYTDFDLLAMGNIKPKSKRLWVGALGAWWVTLGALAILSTAYSSVVKLRSRFAGEATGAKVGVAAEEYATLVIDIPKAKPAAELAGDHSTVGQRIDEFFGRIHGVQYLGAAIAPNLRKVKKAYKELLSTKKKLAHAEGVFEKSKLDEKTPEGVRPQHKSGFLGLLGPKVDSIEWYPEKIKELEQKLGGAQAAAISAGGRSAIIFFRQRQVAAAASQSMHAENGDEWQTLPAPEPRDIEWSNLKMGAYQRQIRQLLVYGLVFLIVVFYMIPIAFVSSFTTLENLQKTLPFLEPIVNISALKTILQAFLPQLALIIFLAILPKFLYFLSKLEGIPAKSHITRAAAGKYFYFMVFNVFLGVTLSASLFNSLKQIIEDPSSIVDLLGSALPQQATFFITFVAFKFFLSKALELSRIVPLLIFNLKKRFMCVTEEEEVEAWAPGQINYVSVVTNDMLIITLAVCYSVIAPMILPFTAVYFLVNWAIMKHQVINVYVPEWESKGRMWPHMHNRILAALVLSQITMIGFFAIKKFAASAALIPLPIITIAYFCIAQGRYYQAFQVASLDVVSRDPPEAAPTAESLKLMYAMEYLQPAEEVGETTRSARFVRTGRIFSVPENEETEEFVKKPEGSSQV